MSEPELVVIPAGAFTMGLSTTQIDQLAAQSEMARAWYEKGRFNREQPMHTLTLPEFRIGRFPVTVGEFRCFVAAGGYAESVYWTAAGWVWCVRENITAPREWDDPQWCDSDHLPVVGVSWYAATAYCAWLSAATGHAYRLPTEAEWEKAARGTEARLFPWGNTFYPARCNMRDSGPGHAVPVGTYSPHGDSPYGCAEMVGNVSEWTLSGFMPYPYAADERDDPAGEHERATRGGSWHSPLVRARSTARGMNDPWFRDTDLGFRVVRDAP